MLIGGAMSLLSVFSFVSNAATWADNGAYSISWYDKNQTEFQLSSPQELAGVAYLVNNNFTSFSGQTICLSGDVDLAGREWIPIGTGNTKFKGNFNGNNYSILNCVINEAGSYSNTGFWTILSGNRIENLTYKAQIDDSQPYIGGLAGSATDATFSNVSSDCNIKFYRTWGGSTSLHPQYCFGGVVGNSEDCTYEKVKVSLSCEFTFGWSSGSTMFGAVDLALGGVVGEGFGDSFYMCEANNDDIEISINGYVADSYYSSSSSSIDYGGIVGSGRSCVVTSCFAKTYNFSGFHNTGTYDGASFDYSGIGGNCKTIENSVAQTYNYTIKGHAYSWVAAWYHTHSTFGGVSGETYGTVAGCYSNNDYVKNVSKVGGDNTGESGSTSFSVAQMNTQEFVDEINMYGMLNLDSQNWTLKDGELSLKWDDEEASIEEIECDFNSGDNDYTIYDINGRVLKSLAKGVNIIRYKNGRSKKVLVR